jgi:hypothetical protein
VTPGEIKRFCGGHGLVREHLPDQLVDQVGVFDGGQRPEPARRVSLRRGRDAERTETIVASEVQILEQREPRWLVNEANHTLAPTIRPRVVDRAHGGALVDRQKLFGYQWQILTERETVFQPVLGVAQRHTLRRTHQVELADQDRALGLRQQPQVELIVRLIRGRALRVDHLRTGLRPRRASAEAAERTARRLLAVRTSRSSAPRSLAGAASSGNALTQPINHNAVA